MGRTPSLIFLALLGSVLLAGAGAQAAPTLTADRLDLRGSFTVAGPAAYFLDDPKMDASKLNFQMTAARMDVEVDTAAASASLLHIVATPGDQTTASWSRSNVELTSRGNDAYSEFAVLANDGARVEGEASCLGVVAGSTVRAIHERANMGRPDVVLPNTPLLSLGGCAQTLTLHGDFRFVFWGWKLHSQDASGQADDITTGVETTAGSEDTIALQTKQQAYITAHDATLTLRLPASPRWSLASASLDLLGDGLLALRDAKGDITLDGQSSPLPAGDTTMTLTQGALLLAPHDGRVGGAVRGTSMAQSQAVSSLTDLMGTGVGAVGLVLCAAVVVYLVRVVRSLRNSEEPALASGPFEAAKAEFASLFDALPDAKGRA